MVELKRQGREACEPHGGWTTVIFALPASRAAPSWTLVSGAHISHVPLHADKI